MVMRPTARVKEAIAKMNGAKSGKLVLWNHPRLGSVADLPDGTRLWDVTVDEGAYLLTAWFKTSAYRRLRDARAAVAAAEAVDRPAR